MTPPQPPAWFPLHAQKPAYTKLALDYHPDFATALGRMLERWAALEAELIYSFVWLSGSTREAAWATLYSLTAIRTKIDVVRNVAKTVLPDGVEKAGFMWLLTKISDACAERNTFVHGEYWTGPNGLLLDANKVGTTFLDAKAATIERIGEHIALIEGFLYILGLVNTETPEFWVLHRHARFKEAHRKVHLARSLAIT